MDGNGLTNVVAMDSGNSAAMIANLKRYLTELNDGSSRDCVSGH